MDKGRKALNFNLIRFDVCFSILGKREPNNQQKLAVFLKGPYSTVF